MRVLGIDPGFATTGYGVVERVQGRLAAVAFGAIRTPVESPQSDRLALLQEAIADLIHEHSPEAVAVERLFFNANVRTAMAVGQASGVALATAAANGLDVSDYTPLEVKQAVVGVGNASKHQVQAMVTSLLGLASAPRPADAADACALAICHLTRARLRAAIGQAAT
jgi:crossover junction endodeoxyribonuclease RuvC